MGPGFQPRCLNLETVKLRQLGWSQLQTKHHLKNQQWIWCCLKTLCWESKIMKMKWNLQNEARKRITEWWHYMSNLDIPGQFLPWTLRNLTDTHGVSPYLHNTTENIIYLCMIMKCPNEYSLMEREIISWAHTVQSILLRSFNVVQSCYWRNPCKVVQSSIVIHSQASLMRLPT